MPFAIQAMDAPLERLVRHVVEAMHPLEVWLFGSRAENRARPTSDYDLLVASVVAELLSATTFPRSAPVMWLAKSEK